MSTSGGGDQEESLCLVSSLVENGTATEQAKPLSKNSQAHIQSSDSQIKLLRDDSAQNEDDMHENTRLLANNGAVRMSELNDFEQSAEYDSHVVDEDGNIYVTPSSNVVDEDGNIYVTSSSNDDHPFFVTSNQASVTSGCNGDISHMNSIELESPDDQPCGTYEVIVAEVHNAMAVRDIVDDKMKKLIDSVPESDATDASRDDGADEEAKSVSLEAAADQDDETTVITDTSAVTTPNERTDSQGEQDMREPGGVTDDLVPLPGSVVEDGTPAAVPMATEMMPMMFPLMMPPVPLPPGLHELFDTGQLVIHKANLRHNTVIHEKAAGRFEVIDETRRMMFYVEQAVPENRKTFLFKIYNRDKQEVASVINPLSRTCIMCDASWHCLPICHFQAMVFAPPGQVAGFVRRSRTCFLQEFEILNAQEDVLLTLRGGTYDLEVYSPDLEHELGRLSVHGWHGIMHEVRRSNEDIGITFPIDLDTRVKMVLLGAVFAIDWLYATKGGRR